jgi:hypothetical protein
VIAPCGIEVAAGRPLSAWPVAPLHVGQLADWIRRAGVLVAVAGAFEATPDGTARLWRQVTSRAGQLRGRAAKWFPWLRSDAAPAPLTVAAGVTGKKPRLDGYVAVFDPLAEAWQQARQLYSLHQQLEGRVSDIRREARELAEGVRGELRQAADELRAANSEITVRIREMESRAAQADARGVWIVAAGVVLAGVPDGLAAWPLLGLTVTAVAIAAAVRVGFLVARSARTG